MPFGLRNALATFQRLMNEVVAGLEGCAVYLKNVVIYSNTWRENWDHTRALFDHMAWANLTINLTKCEFARGTVTYLGKVVGQGLVHPVRAKVLAIDEYLPPATKKELMRFMGMVAYYRGFCKNFSTVVTLLINLLSSKVQFDWTSQCKQAFENHLCSCLGSSSSWQTVPGASWRQQRGCWGYTFAVWSGWHWPSSQLLL